MNHIFKKTFYSINSREFLIKEIEKELTRWQVDNVVYRNNLIEFSFNTLKFGSTTTIYRKINHGYFEINEDLNKLVIKYKGYNSINFDIFAIAFCVIMSIVTTWFFLFMLIMFSIQLISRINNLNTIQNEMIKRLSEVE